MADEDKAKKFIKVKLFEAKDLEKKQEEFQEGIELLDVTLSTDKVTAVSKLTGKKITVEILKQDEKD